MRDFIADMRQQYATMTPADWFAWSVMLGVTVALLIYITSQSV